MAKPNPKSNPHTAPIPHNRGEVERRDKLAKELHAAGDELDATLRRIRAYLSWVHRDVGVLRNHVHELQGRTFRKDHGKI